MLLDGLSWSHYSVFAPCIMTQTRVLGRSGGGKMFFVYCSHIMILRLLVIITYKLSIMTPPCIHFVLYFMSPIVCFGICVAIYDILQKISSSFLGILVRNRIK